MEKILWVLKSRKFWASVIGILIATGVLRMSDLEETALVEAVLTIVTTIVYVISTAVEDAARHKAGVSE